MGPETDGLLDLAFRFRDLQVTHREDSRPFLTGKDLTLIMGGDGRLIPDPGKRNMSRSISLEIEGLTVPDLSLLQRHIPAKWPFQVYGGEGTLWGSMSLTPTALGVDLKLDSDNADMGIRQYRFDTNLDAALVLDNPNVLESSTSVGGSFIVLSNATFKKEGQRTSEPWSSSLILKSGEFSLVREERKQDKENAIDLLSVFGEQKAGNILGESNGNFEFDAQVSSLAWIGVLLKEDYRARVDGSSRIHGQAHLLAGLPAPGTDVEITSDELSVSILDYVSRGNGKIRLTVEEGGEFPDWGLAIRLSDADMKRKDSAKASVEDVEMSLDALVKDVNFDQEPDRAFTMRFQIPSARVTDMATFNSYLPPDGPLMIKGGEASLSADILLLHNDADGWIRLHSEGLDAMVDDQSIKADLNADISLVGGVPADMLFDFTGSEIVLDRVHVAGQKVEFDKDYWSAVLKLTRGETTWTNPLKMDLEAQLSMSDSKPFVALFDNQGWRPKFLTNALTVEDIEGTVRLNMANDIIVIPHAQLSSDKLFIGVKATIAKENSTGVLYTRYKTLDAIIRFKDGKKNLDLIKALEKYEQYEALP